MARRWRAEGAGVPHVEALVGAGLAFSYWPEGGVVVFQATSQQALGLLATGSLDWGGLREI